MFSSMAQSYYDLEQSVQYLQNLLIKQGSGVAIQKIFSSSHLIILALRFRGFNKFVYLGRGKEFEGLFYYDKNIISAYRVQDSFLQFLRAHLRGGILSNITLDKIDRAIKLDYIIKGKKSVLLFFWRGRELFFIWGIHQQDNFWAITCSWERKKRVEEIIDDQQLFTLFDEVGRKTLRSYDKSNACASIDEYLNFLERGLKIESSKKIKRLKRKIENIKGDIVKFEQWNRIYQDVIVDNYQLEDSYFQQAGLRVKFKDNQSYYQKKSFLLDKLKRAKEYQLKARNRLHESEEKLAIFEGKKKSLNLKIVFNPMIHVHEGMSRKKIVANRRSSIEGVKIFSCPEGTFAVGTSASSNDYIRSKWAKKSDYWFHLDGDTSAHAIWKSCDGERPSLKIINRIASAIFSFSGFHGSEINIIYTQVKNIKPVKNSPGKVIYKKEKHLRVDFYKEWRENCS